MNALSAPFASGTGHRLESSRIPLRSTWRSSRRGSAFFGRTTLRSRSSERIVGEAIGMLEPANHPMMAYQGMVDISFPPQRPVPQAQTLGGQEPDIMALLCASIQSPERHEKPDPWSVITGLVGSVDGPPDLAAEHDHYLYGTPKRG